MFNCSAGKDRTGIGAALLLYALSVTYKKIEGDNLASNIYHEERNVKLVEQMVKYKRIKQKVAEDIVSVKPEYSRATFDAINHQYEFVDNFLRGPLELNEAQLTILKNKFHQ
ncbi:MAG: tyrosine-protein phosphatase [Bacteroidota bacterium]|nr:tyrosine-protein phosphatase [Bacteroidota bacterium]